MVYSAKFFVFSGMSDYSIVSVFRSPIGEEVDDILRKYVRDTCGVPRSHGLGVLLTQGAYGTLLGHTIDGFHSGPIKQLGPDRARRRRPSRPARAATRFA